MSIHHVLVASFLALSAAGAMSQDIDQGETLQARSLAARHVHAASSEGQLRLGAGAIARPLEAGAHQEGSRAETAPKIAWAKGHVSGTYGKNWLAGDKRHPGNLVVAGHG